MTAITSTAATTTAGRYRAHEYVLRATMGVFQAAGYFVGTRLMNKDDLVIDSTLRYDIANEVWSTPPCAIGDARDVLGAHSSS